MTYRVRFFLGSFCCSSGLPHMVVCAVLIALNFIVTIENGHPGHASNAARWVYSDTNLSRRYGDFTLIWVDEVDMAQLTLL